jgi:very-short-patch-repair endonuclease
MKDLALESELSSGDTAREDAALRIVAERSRTRLAVGGRGTLVAPVSAPPELSPETECKLAAGAGKWAARVQSGVSEVLRRCESPVERLFLLAAIGHPQSDLFDAGTRRRFHKACGLLVACEVLDGAALFALQAPAGDYRLDFALVADGGVVGVAVEIDGHDFHETKVAAARDKRRDRALTAAGWSPLRFTGSEVWQDAERCFAEALDVFQRRGGWSA